MPKAVDCVPESYFPQIFKRENFILFLHGLRPGTFIETGEDVTARIVDFLLLFVNQMGMPVSSKKVAVRSRSRVFRGGVWPAPLSERLVDFELTNFVYYHSGYFCLANATEYLSNPCPAGHYCPQGTTYSDEYKCPVGTFNTAAGQTNDTACLSCTGGSYCQTQGLAAPTGNCSAGWYCLDGAIQAMPTDPLQGGRCPQGAYCPVGSENYTACDPGKYCQLQGMSAPSGDCSPGEWCLMLYTKFYR